MRKYIYTTLLSLIGFVGIFIDVYYALHLYEMSLYKYIGEYLTGFVVLVEILYILVFLIYISDSSSKVIHRTWIMIAYLPIFINSVVIGLFTVGYAPPQPILPYSDITSGISFLLLILISFMYVFSILGDVKEKLNIKNNKWFKIQIIVLFIELIIFILLACIFAL